MSTTIDLTNAAVSERRESKVRSYWRLDAIFNAASSITRHVDGRKYIDFLPNASSVNYRHKDFHIIAAGRYQRIPGGHDASGIASGDARRGDKRTVGLMTQRCLGRMSAIGIHAAALTEYLMHDGRTAPAVRNSSGPRCGREGGKGANHFDAPGFQRGGALRRS